MRPPLWCCRLWARFFAEEPDWLKELRKDRKTPPARPRRRLPAVTHRELTLAGLCACLTFGAVWIGGSDIPDTSLQGQPRIVDGDTLDFHGTRVRLYGIDAPEASQLCRNRWGGEYACGQISTSALAGKIGGQSVRCDTHGKDRYQRDLAHCYVGDVDLGEWLVREGHAVAYWRYSTRYIPAEFAARFDGNGIWAGDFERPEDWRRSQRQRGE